VRIKLAPMSRLIPQEIAKNGTAAEKSRMVVGGLKAYYSIGRGSQAITRLARPKGDVRTVAEPCRSKGTG
jgi:hypothetical protein